MRQRGRGPRRPGALLALYTAWALAGGCTTAPDPAIAERLSRLEARLDQLAAHVERLSVASRPEPRSEPEPRYRVEGIDIGDSPTLGPEDAPVTIVGFADFECPYCASAVATLDQVLETYPGLVRRVFKHYPMPVHKRAPLAHRASLAAAQVGKFWEMYRVLYSNQERLDPEGLRESARAIGLDLDQFDAYLASGEGLATIQADRALGRRLGVLGVPAFFINGRLVAGAQPFELFREMIDEELAAPASKG